MEGSKVSEARRIPAFFDELYGIQDQNHGYGEDGEDGDHDEEFDEGEALMTHYYSILAEMGREENSLFVIGQCRMALPAGMTMRSSINVNEEDGDLPRMKRRRRFRTGVNPVRGREGSPHTSSLRGRQRASASNGVKL